MNLNHQKRRYRWQIERRFPRSVPFGKRNNHKTYACSPPTLIEFQFHPTALDHAMSVFPKGYFENPSKYPANVKIK